MAMMESSFFLFLLCICMPSSARVLITYDDLYSAQMLNVSSEMQQCNHNFCWDNSLVTKFVKISINATPSLLLNESKSWLVEWKDPLVIFSFVSRSQQAILYGIFEPLPNVSYYPFSDSREEMALFIKEDDLTECLKFTASFRKAIVYLLYSLYVTFVTLITDEHYCAKELYKDLLSTIEATSTSKDVRINLQQLSFNSANTQHLFSELYSLKTHSVSVLIPILSVSDLSIFFEASNRFSLLSPENLWLIPDYVDGQVSTILPARILTFSKTAAAETVEANPYRNLQKTIPRLYNAVLETFKEYDGSRLPKLSPKVLYAFNSPTPEQNFRLDIRYRNLADTNAEWLFTEAQVKEDQFIVQGNTLPLLRSITGGSTTSFLRVVTVVEPPYTMTSSLLYDQVKEDCVQGIVCRYSLASNSSENNVTCCIGFIIELLQLISTDLNLQVDLYIVPDGYYGALQSNGEWNGMIGEIQRRNADLAVAGLTITGERSEVVDFTVPYFEAEMGILVKPKIAELSFVNWEFIAPLSPTLQIVLWFVVLGAMSVNFMFENDYFFLALLSKKFYKTLRLYPPDDSMIYITGVFLQREMGGRNPNQLSARVHAVCFAFAMVVVVTSYTAVLAAWSVQNQDKHPFSGSNDERMRSPTVDFKFATIKSSSYSSFFKNADNPVIHRMGVFMNRYNVDNTSEGVEQVRSGQLDAFIDDHQFLHWYISHDSQDCTLRLYSDPLMKSGYAFAISKGHPLLALFNSLMLQYREDEIAVTMYKKWTFPFCQRLFTSTQKRLSPENFGGLIVILPCTMLLCGLMLFPEHFFHRVILKKMYEFFDARLRRTGRGRGVRFNQRSSAYEKRENIDLDLKPSPHGEDNQAIQQSDV